MSARWSSEELRTLHRFWPDLSTLQEKLSSRSTNAILLKAWQLGLGHLRKWTKEDDQRLRKVYHRVPFPEVVKHFPGRTPGAVESRAKRLGLYRKPFWTEQELDVIRNLYPRASKEEILRRLPGRTWRSIIGKARWLGVERRRTWKRSDDLKLAKLFPSASREQLLSEFPHRSFHSIKVRAQKLHLRREGHFWSASEDDTIRRLFPTVPRDEVLAALPGRTWEAIRQRAFTIGVSRQSKWDEWSPREDHILRLFYGRVPIRRWRGILVGRTHSAITTRANKIGLSGNRRVNRCYAVNARFFRDVNPLTAYFAGFLAADGCVYVNHGAARLVVSLQARDLGHLEKLRTAISYGGPIKVLHQNGRSYVTMVVAGVSEMLDDLRRNFNITPRKTYSLRPPTSLDEVNALAFIMGLIDGDGHVSVKRGLAIGLTGTRAMLEWVKYWFDRVVPPKKGEHRVGDYKNRRAAWYHVTGKRARLIAKRLLQLEVPYMERKWNQVLPLITDLR